MRVDLPDPVDPTIETNSPSSTLRFTPLRTSRTFPADEKLFETLYHRFESPEAWRIYDDVLAALESLTHRGIKLAVVSNWDERLRPLLKRLQLERYFEAVVVSCEVGCAKPLSGIFERAAQLLAVTPGDMLHVGDSAEEDLAGAKAAGLHGLLINRQGTRPSREEIRSLREIEGRLPPPTAISV